MMDSPIKIRNIRKYICSSFHLLKHRKNIQNIRNSSSAGKKRGGGMEMVFKTYKYEQHNLSMKLLTCRFGYSILHVSLMGMLVTSYSTGKKALCY